MKTDYLLADRKLCNGCDDAVITSFNEARPKSQCCPSCYYECPAIPDMQVPSEENSTPSGVHHTNTSLNSTPRGNCNTIYGGSVISTDDITDCPTSSRFSDNENSDNYDLRKLKLVSTNGCMQMKQWKCSNGSDTAYFIGPGIYNCGPETLLADDFLSQCNDQTALTKPLSNSKVAGSKLSTFKPLSIENSVCRPTSSITHSSIPVISTTYNSIPVTSTTYNNKPISSTTYNSIPALSSSTECCRPTFSTVYSYLPASSTTYNGYTPTSSIDNRRLAFVGGEQYEEEDTILQCPQLVDVLTEELLDKQADNNLTNKIISLKSQGLTTTIV